MENKPWIVFLTRQDFEYCEYLQNKIFATGLRRTPNPTDLEDPDRFDTGYCGEIAAARALRAEGFNITHNIEADGRSHKHDITVHLATRNVIVEIKTSGKPTHQYCGFPTVQEFNADFICGARLDRRNQYCRIMGFQTKREVQRWEVRSFKPGTWSFATKYENMTAPSEFVKILNSIDKPAFVD
jgi:hypothetical protein